MTNLNETIDNLLIDLGACRDAQIWAKGKTWKEIYNTCHRGDWLLWLFKKTNPNDLQKLTLTKGHCANTVRHLIKDEKGIKSIDAAIKFGEGVISIEQLNIASKNLYAAEIYDACIYTNNAAEIYANAAADAAANAAADADGAASGAAAGACAAAAYAASDKIQNQLLTADICRKYLPIEIWKLEYSTNY